jgi:Ca2+-binding RTX toxin-like protein
MANQNPSVPGSGYGSPYVDSLVWGGAGWTGGPIFYFFGSGNAIDEFGDPFFGRTWRSFEIDAFEQAIALFENVCNIDFQLAPSQADADIVWWAVSSAYIGPSTLGAHEIPTGSHGDPIYGYFNQQHSTWTAPTLAQGGFGFITVIHEMGHGLGLAHPHDGGPSGDAFPGVDNSRDTGDFGLNQGIWTTMTYNDGWRALPSSSFAYGWQGGPMAFDIAALQAIYGVNTTHATGDDTYVLPGINASGTFFSCIWDAAGTDTISAANLSGNAFINLNDASLEEGDPNAGGYVSWMAGIRGGFTIANNAIIENAIGGKGNDKIVGNDIVNALTGGLGNDSLDGGLAADLLTGGGGNDVYVVDDSGDSVTESDPGKVGGIDLVQSNISHKLGVNVENLTLTGLDNIDATGNELANILIGNKGANDLDGGLGADKMNGGAGDDNYTVDEKGDVIVESLAGPGGHDIVSTHISLILGANLEDLVLLDSSDLAGTGNGLANTIEGNSGKNSLLGLTGNDTLIAGAGNDTLDGGLGADSLKGGDDDDLYIQDSKLDIIDETGASLNDELRTNQALAVLIAGIEHYSFIGGVSVNFTAGGQNNRLAGTKVADTLAGDGGDDTLIGGAGADNLSGGDGDDVYGVDNKADKIAETTGTDRVESAIAYVLGDGLENLTLTGKAATGTGNGLNNDIIGNVFANQLNGAGGTDTLTGGDGNDTYFIDGGDDVVETNGSAKGGIDLIVSMVDYALGANEENLTLDAKGTGELATGNELKNVLIGNSQDNTLDGGADNDKMLGGAGDDTYKVDSTGDLMIESLKGDAGGFDHVDSSASFALGANLEDLTLLDDDDVAGTGNGLDNEIEGNDGNNKLSGLAGADTLDGDDGNDTLDGGVGADKMDGGNGDDVYVVDNAGDLVTELGTDSGDELRTNQALAGVHAGIEHYTFLGAAALNFTADGAANRISGTKANDKIDGGAGNDTLAGNAGNDTLTGGNDNDSLDGGIGNDSLIGGDGDDVYVVNSAADKISDSSGSDTVQSIITFTLADGLENLQLLGTAAVNGTGNSAANIITGNAGANKLTGGDGADTLDGGLGNDIIIGGAGADSIDVTAGNDRVFYLDKLDSGDVVTGFDGNAIGGQDQVNLDLLFDSLGVAAKDRTARASVVDNGADVEIRVDADGAGGTFELLVVTLNTTDDVTVGTDVILGT